MYPKKPIKWLAQINPRPTQVTEKNEWTSVLAVFMTELWKRYSAVLYRRWHITNYTFNDEFPRPHYISFIKKHTNFTDKIAHYVTKIKEPDVKPKIKVPRVIFSYITVVFLVSFVVVE